MLIEWLWKCEHFINLRKMAFSTKHLSKIYLICCNITLLLPTTEKLTFSLPSSIRGCLISLTPPPPPPPRAPFFSSPPIIFFPPPPPQRVPVFFCPPPPPIRGFLISCTPLNRFSPCFLEIMMTPIPHNKHRMLQNKRMGNAGGKV